MSLTNTVHSSHPAQHVARALVSFTTEHYLTLLTSTGTPVRPSIRPSTRPSLLSTSHGDLPCADPSTVSFGLLAETHSPTGYEPNAKGLTGEDTSFLFKPMFFHRQSMTSTCDSAESIAVPPPESDLDDEQIRNMLVSPLYLQVREASADRSRVYHSFRKNSVSSSSHLRESALFSHNRRSSQETFSDREGVSSGHQPGQGKDETLFMFSDPEEASRLVLEEQRDHLLPEAKYEILKQECKVDSLVTCTR